MAGLIHVALWRASGGSYPAALRRRRDRLVPGPRSPAPPRPSTASTSASRSACGSRGRPSRGASPLSSDPILWKPEFGYGGAGTSPTYVAGVEGAGYLAAPDPDRAGRARRGVAPGPLRRLRGHPRRLQGMDRRGDRRRRAARRRPSPSPGWGGSRGCGPRKRCGSWRWPRPPPRRRQGPRTQGRRCGPQWAAARAVATRGSAAPMRVPSAADGDDRDRAPAGGEGGAGGRPCGQAGEARRRDLPASGIPRRRLSPPSAAASSMCQRGWAWAAAGLEPGDEEQGRHLQQVLRLLVAAAGAQEQGEAAIPGPQGGGEGVAGPLSRAGLVGVAGLQGEAALPGSAARPRCLRRTRPLPMPVKLDWISETPMPAASSTVR